MMGREGYPLVYFSQDDAHECYPCLLCAAPCPKTHLARRGLLTLLILLFLICGFFAYFNWLHDRELREVIAETDRSDPNWRLADLEAQRAVVRDAENSAFQIQKVKSLIPANWPYWDSKKSPLIDSETLIFLSVVSGSGRTRGSAMAGPGEHGGRRINKRGGGKSSPRFPVRFFPTPSPSAHASRPDP